MSVAAQPAHTRVPVAPRLILACVGFSATVAQIVLMRELLIVSYGNELSLGFMLALWLLWTATGSHLLGRLFRQAPSRALLPLLLMAAAVAFYAAILMVRHSRSYWHAATGEVLGPVPIFLTALFTLALFCPLSGWLFVTGTRYYADLSDQGIADAGSSMYLLEAIGSAAGGVIVSTIFTRLLTSLQIATVVGLINLLACLWIWVSGRRVWWIVSAAALAAGIWAASQTGRLEVNSLSQAWPGFHAVAATTSPYGSVAVIETEGYRSVIQNGIVLFTSGDQAAAEEAVHFPLLQHPAPRSVLLIGGGLNGSIAEILKYPSVTRVDYVELDPAVLRLGREYFPEAWSTLASDSRVHVHESDGRLFLKSALQQFDAIILNLPEPQTAQLNRFYTEEFFREAASRLAPGGVFGFQIRASEEYLSPQMANFLRCINGTLRRVFLDVVTVPGEIVHFLSSNRPASLTTDPGLLVSRLRERGIVTTYIREYYLPYRMAASRVNALTQELQPRPETRVNHDFLPIAYFFNIELWSTQFSSKYRILFESVAAVSFREFFIGILVMVALITAILARYARHVTANRIAVGYSISVMGLTMMGTEILLLLGFQSIYGYVFDELAAIIAAFMAGVGLGSWLAVRRATSTVMPMARNLRSLLVVQVLATGMLMLLTPSMAVLGTLTGGTVLVRLAFLTMALGCGFVGGYQFPLAMRVFTFATGKDASSSPGLLYGLDLLGASIGAGVVSAFLLPLYGFARTAEILALANLGPVLLLALSCRTSRVISSSR